MTELDHQKLKLERMEREARWSFAFSLRLAGRTVEEIAGAAGVSVEQARRWVRLGRRIAERQAAVEKDRP